MSATFDPERPPCPCGARHNPVLRTCPGCGLGADESEWDASEPLVWAGGRRLPSSLWEAEVLAETAGRLLRLRAFAFLLYALVPVAAVWVRLGWKAAPAGMLFWLVPGLIYLALARGLLERNRVSRGILYVLEPFVFLGLLSAIMAPLLLLGRVTGGARMGAFLIGLLPFAVFAVQELAIFRGLLGRGAGIVFSDVYARVPFVGLRDTPTPPSPSIAIPLCRGVLVSAAVIWLLVAVSIASIFSFAGSVR